ncbi:hypothetical protein ACTXGU_05075 [Niallia sp. 01092]|uniref:hypothetical protein n=1 Tax=Niallia sp. 01092 TaxID=3457759 RepID=UPI003FD62045
MEKIVASVSISNVRVRKRNSVAGDADKVIVIPKEFEERVLAIAVKIEAAEDKIREATEKFNMQ